MSSVVDERVVEMRFDNRQFEKNVQTSLTTLDKLKQSLNFDNAAKSFDKIDSASKNVNMGALSNAVETVRSRFSAMEVVAITALTNITNSVVNTGKRMLKSLTIDPISQGFGEYELKMDSIQTILMSTGESLETVNKYLNELNTYSDKTIYSFKDMTSNIGKFTNMGVKLKDAVMAIQGVSNVAAVSGANTNEASRAMYNFAQALSAGHVKLIDWRSIELANMGTVEFKNQLLEAAVAAGTLEKSTDGMYKVLTTNLNGSTMPDVINATHNFNDSLSYQWMTTEVLVNTLKDYADETTDIGKKAFRAATEIKTFTMLMGKLTETVGSGWAQTWEILFGNFEEAKELWTEVGNVLGDFIDKQSDARNALLQGWKDLGGRSTLIDAAKDAFQGLVNIVTPIKDAFREIFPPVTAQNLMNLTNALKEFTSHLKLGEESSENLKNTFKGLFAILDIVKQLFLSVGKSVLPLFGGLDNIGGGILTITGRIGSFLVQVDEFIKKNDVVGRSVEAICELVKKVTSPILDVTVSLLDRIQERTTMIGESVGSLKKDVSSAIEKIGDVLSKCKIVDFLESLWNAGKNITGGIFASLGKLIGDLIDKLGDADFNGFLDFLNSLSLGGLALGASAGVSGVSSFLDNIVNAVKGVKDVFGTLTSPVKQINEVLNSVKDSLCSFQKDLQAKTLIKIAQAIGILALSIVAISFVDSDKLSASLGAITVMFANLIGAMALYEKLGKVKSTGAKNMLVFAGAVLLLSGAVKKLGNLDTEQLKKGLIGTGVLLAEIDLFLSNAKFGKKAISTATGMVIMSGAIKMLASVVENLGSLDGKKLTKGLVGVGVLLKEIDLFLSNAKFGKKTISTATGILIMSEAIKVLALVCNDFASMSVESLSKGLVSIGVLLAELATFTKLTGRAKHVISTGIALVEIAAAMKIFASAMEEFAQLSKDDIKKGLVAIGVALGEVAIATKLMPKNMVGLGTGLVIVGASLEILTNVLKRLGNFNGDEIRTSLVMLGVAMGELAVALNLMKGTAGGSTALLVASAALGLLVPSLSALGKLSIGSIVKGLTAMAGSFAVIGVAGTMLAPLTHTLVALSGAFALFGVSVFAIGAGLTSISVGLTTLAGVGVAAAASIVASLTIIITGFANLLPLIMTQIGRSVVAFCKVISESAPAIGDAVKSVVLTVIDVLVSCVPELVDGAFKILTSALQALAEYTPQIVDSIFQFLINLLAGVEKKLPELIKIALDVLMSFFSGITDALGGIDTDSLLKGIVGIGLLAGIMTALSSVAALVPGAMLGILGMGAVVAEMAVVLAAIGALAQIPGLSWFIAEGGNLLQGIGTAIGQFVGGIVGGFASGISSQFPKIGTDLSNFMTNVQPFLDGASSIQPSILDGVRALGETILILTAADILQGATSWLTGGSSLSDFAFELIPFGQAMRNFSNVISGMDAGLVAGAAAAGKALAEMASTLPNTGGLVSWFTGGNDMDKFGKQLVAFGESMSAYSLAVAGLDVNAINNSATAGQALVQLANALPNTGGLVSWFTGDNDMDKFGSQLVSFGSSLKGYSDNVSGIDASALSGIITQVNRLVTMAQNMSGVDTSGMSGFGNALTKLGEVGIDGFINAFANANSRVSEAATTMMTTFQNAVNSQKGNLLSLFSSLVQNLLNEISGKQGSFQNAGMNLMTGLSTGMASRRGDVTSAMRTIAQGGLRELNGKRKDFQNAGREMMNSLAQSIRTMSSSVRDAVTYALNSGLSKLQGSYSDSYDAAYYFVLGFADGINANAYLASARSRAMAAAAAEAARHELDEHSPSKVGYEIGDYFGVAFVNALDDYAKKSYDAGAEIGSSARDGLGKAILKVSDFIDSDLDTTPTITPVLDLTNVENGFQTIGNLIGSGYSLDLAAKTSTSVHMGALGKQSAAPNNSDVVNAISSLRADLAELRSIVGNLKVVMDTGTLVGSLVGPIDDSLGKRASYIGRGI